MPRRFSTVQLLRYAGLLTWACAGVALLLSPFLGDTYTPETTYLIWSVAHLAFGAAFWQLSATLDQPDSRLQMPVAMLALMTFSALEVSHITQTSLGGVLLLVVAGMLPWVLPLRWSVSWLIGQNIALTVVVMRWQHIGDLAHALVHAGMFVGYSSFCFVVSFIARRQAEQRDSLRKLNSELRATQSMLADSTRLAERLRISRELHDLIGHHLTALSLNLEVAGHLVEGKARNHVEQAHAVAKLLLADVREVVGSMRGGEGINLSAALSELAEGVPKPAIHMSVDEGIKTQDPQRAQVVLRCVQEIITNAAKHAQAENLWLTVTEDENGLQIVARDDGRGINTVNPGNGLTGMRERLGQLGGELEVQSAPGKGFGLKAWLPQEVIL